MSADGEWAARLHGLHLLASWQGIVTAILDATNTLTMRYTSALPKGTLWSLLFREFYGVSLGAEMREIWVAAEHGARRRGMFAALNATAHHLADKGRCMAKQNKVPQLQLLHGMTYQGPPGMSWTGST